MTTIVESVNALRARCGDARQRHARVGLVPTMGYLHEGHRSLMRAARRHTDLVVTSLFVNPIQFGADEDLERYPRDLDADVEACAEEGVDLLFAPPLEEMYPDGEPLTTVHVSGLTDDLCGSARPTHFDGVATVVSKLFAITAPCTAFFGRKDYQQYLVVRRLAADLDLPVEVVGCPLVRESDGLALSSRNAYLREEERVAATVLFRALSALVDHMAQSGSRAPLDLVARAREPIDAEPLVDLEYLEMRDARDLSSVDVVDREVVVALAARVGVTRLIDNVRIAVDGDGMTADLGVGGPQLLGASVGTLA